MLARAGANRRRPRFNRYDVGTADVYYSHGSAISHVEATSLRLTVQYLAPDDPIWQRLWLLSCMYDHDCRKSRYLKVFEGRNRSTAVAAPPVAAAGSSA
jgi:hypothetical protein